MMNSRLLFAFLICFISCQRTKKAPTVHSENPKVEHNIVASEFQTIIDSANVVGAILLYDYQKGNYFSNNFEWAAEGKLPASTFKIANSIIGLETGVIENDSAVFKWDGKPKGNPNWEKDLLLKDAFHFSCVPCYQDVARKIGSDSMNRYLDLLDYGTMDVDSNAIDNFWLRGSSRISPMQQIDFLRRLYESKLPISKRTEKIMKNLMIIKETENYIIRGKTGLSNENELYNGWFVGYVVTQNNVYFFTTNIEPNSDFDFDTFIQTRIDLTFRALDKMGFLKRTLQA